MYKIKITNLPRWISEIHLKQFFNNCGKMLEAKVELDVNTLRPLGFGYIEFNDEESLNKALEKDGAMLDGSVIKVEYYNEAEQLSLAEDLVEIEEPVEG